ncbi:MAG TPA: mechanosensitive ion channel family protein [Pseudomonadales bacterium]
MTLDWLDHQIVGNTVLTWATGLGTFLALWALLAILHRLISERLRAAVERNRSGPVFVFSQITARTQPWFAPLLALFVGLRLLVSPPDLATLSATVFTIGLMLQVGLWAAAALDAWLTLRRRRQIVADPSEVAATDLLRVMVRVVVWTVVLIVTLDSLGINVTALVAGLGIGGIAVALAAQNVLGDLFASLSIVLDRPFVVGDALGIDDFTGRVERVGLKTTRLRSTSGEQLIFSNTDLLDSRIRNFQRMTERRVAFSIGVAYGTHPDVLQRIPAIVRAVIEAERDVRFEFAHFSRYGDFALIHDIVYHVLSPEARLQRELQHRINLALYRCFRDQGIAFALPARALDVAGVAGVPRPGEAA